MLKIINCEVIEISNEYVKVKFHDQIFICPAKEISDYKINPNIFFTLNKKYKFLLLNKNIVSYKAIRPKQIKNKKTIVPTISGSHNLEKHLIKSLKKVKTKQSKTIHKST